MRKLIYALILLVVVVSGLLFANRGIKKEASKKPATNSSSAAEMKSAREQWEATPDGVAFKKWEASSAGQKVLAGADKIKNNENTEAVVTSLTLPPGTRLGFAVMARIDGEDYLLSFGVEGSNEFEQLRSLKVNDKIIIRSRSVSYAPKYSYPIIAGDYVERDGKVIYKWVRPKGGC